MYGQHLINFETAQKLYHLGVPPLRNEFFYDNDSEIKISFLCEKPCAFKGIDLLTYLPSHFELNEKEYKLNIEMQTDGLICVSYLNKEHEIINENGWKIKTYVKEIKSPKLCKSFKYVSSNLSEALGGLLVLLIEEGIVDCSTLQPTSMKN